MSLYKFTHMFLLKNEVQLKKEKKKKKKKKEANNNKKGNHPNLLLKKSCLEKSIKENFCLDTIKNVGYIAK